MTYFFGCQQNYCYNMHYIEIEKNMMTQQSFQYSFLLNRVAVSFPHTGKY